MSNQRIAINTISTYSRTVLSAGLALFSSRWVINGLGMTDFGLFSVMGSILVFITFLNTVMANSASRHFAFCIGQNDGGEVNRWFNSAFGIHLCLAVFLVITGWPIGEYVIAHVLTVPIHRLVTSLWVFRISLVSAFFSMISVPFVAMFTAKQRITELAIWGILQSVLTFFLAGLLHHVAHDRLLFYGVGMVFILVSVQVAQSLRALKVFDECRLANRLWFDRQRCREIFSFAVWNLIGALGVLFRDQGSAIALNLFFGPSVNASYGIANQLSTQANQLSSAMVGAFSPEITASEGRGDRVRMLSLSQRASKFSTILVLLLAVPLMVEMDYILKLWLHMSPPYTVLFCQLILCSFLIDRLTSGQMLAVYAYGKIAGYQVTIGATLLLTLPLALLFFRSGLAPTSLGIAFMVTMSVASVGRVLWVRSLFDIPIRSWVSTVVWPCSIVALLATGAALAPRWLMVPSMLRLFAVFVVSAAVSLSTAWFLFLDEKERLFVTNVVKGITFKLRTNTISCLQKDPSKEIS